MLQTVDYSYQFFHRPLLIVTLQLLAFAPLTQIARSIRELKFR
jgi:hypothetical protein